MVELGPPGKPLVHALGEVQMIGAKSKEPTGSERIGPARTTLFRILRFLRYLPLIAMLAVCPLIRGCGDNGYSETIGFPVPWASIERPSSHMVDCSDLPAEQANKDSKELPRCFLPGGRVYEAWYFLAEDLEPSKYAILLTSLNIAVLLSAAWLTYRRSPRVSVVLRSFLFQLFVFLLMLGYRILTPFTFLPSLVFLIPIGMLGEQLPRGFAQWVVDHVPGSLLLDVTARVVFLCLLCVAYALALGATSRQQASGPPPRQSLHR